MPAGDSTGIKVVNSMDKTFKILIIALAVLVVFVPIGLIASGTAFGEWGPDELQQAVGYVPPGSSSFLTSGIPSCPITISRAGMIPCQARRPDITSRRSLAFSYAPV